MKKLTIVILLITILFCGCNFNPYNDAIVTKDDMKPRLIESINYSNNIDVVKSVSPAVVGIYSEDGYGASIGTGVAIEKGGYVLTNSHVVTSNNVILYLASGETTTASLVYRDSSLDLAIVKSKVDLPYLSVASSGDYFVGEDVLAIGTPLALQFKHTVTKGIISAKNRTIKVEGSNGITLQNLIQHDASINPGNSGGPLINLRGQVLGINTVKVEDAEGLGFAIPTETITPIFAKISANGEYKPAYLGLMGYDASVFTNNNTVKGVYIYDVQKGSSFYNVGIEKGNILTHFNNKEINNMLDLRKELYSVNVGEEITIRYLKDNFENIAKIKLNENCNNL
ncbi:MAG: trypsin-like serine protease [Clostridiales bacterium]|nr:trypsin-like serine protease [Clostridiales bacterium]